MKLNWQIKKLGEVCDFRRGLTYSKKDEVDISHNIVLRSNNIDIDNVLNLSELRYIRDDVDIPFDKMVKKGAMIICTANGSKNHLGKVALIDKNYRYAYGGFMGQIIPNEEVDSKYLFYFFISDSYKTFVKRISDGANINNLKFSDIERLEIPISPLPEQHRIVAILDKAFEAIEKAKGNAEKNLKNSEEVFESYLTSVFTNPSKDWEEKRLIDVCEKVTDGSHFSPTSSTKDEYPYITVRDIDNDIIDFANCKFINEKDYQLLLKNGCKPKAGDILFSKDGTVGKVTLVDFEKDFVVLSSLAIIRPKDKSINSSLLKYILKDPLFLRTAIGMKTGVAIKRIILRNLKLINIRFPKSLTQQKFIVKKLDALSLETKKMEAIYKQKIDLLDELKKSILQKAFEGEL